MTNGVSDETLANFMNQIINGVKGAIKGENQEPDELKAFKKETVEMIDTLFSCNLPIDRIRYLMTYGVLFEFNDHTRVRFNCFQFAGFLRMAKTLQIESDATVILKDLVAQKDEKYKSAVTMYLQIEKQRALNAKQAMENSEPTEPTAPAGPTPGRN